MAASRKSLPTLFLSAWCVALLGLSACGGGSGGGDSGPTGPTAPPAPVLSLSPESIKTFSFSWADVAGETEYRLLENPDGSSGYTEVASIAANATSYEFEVFLPGRINASYILEACNSIGCTDSNTVFVTSTLAEAVGYVKASNTGSFDNFGWSIALSGDGTTLAVGSPFEASAAVGINGDQGNNAASGSGAAYVFTRNGGSWSQQAYVKASNTAAGAAFGYSVALSEDGATLAVGARREAGEAPNSGAAYVFTRSSGSWSQQAYVKAAHAGENGEFGFSVALSADGDTLAVGARGESSDATGIGGDADNTDSTASGAAYVFSRSGSDWSQQAYVKASNTRAFDNFGFSIALASDGNTLAVGSPGESSNAMGIGGDEGNDEASSSGAVYVYVRSGADWSQQAYVKASNTGAFDRFGGNLALAGDGDTLAVGAISEDSNALGIGGDEGNNEASTSGAAYVFTRSNGAWSQQAYVKASNTEANDRFGESLALSGSGDTLAVGAIYEAGNALGIGGDEGNNEAPFGGAVYVFTRSTGTWSQQAYVKASNTGEENEFGNSVALSGDGNTLAVGSYFEGGAATGIGGDQNDNAPASGAVYLY